MTAPTPASGAPPWAVRLDLAIGLLCLSTSERGALEAAIREAVTAAQAAQRAADAGGLEARAQAVQDSNRTARGGVRGEAVWAAAILREEAKAIRAASPPAADCVLGARDGGPACACAPQPAAEPGRGTWAEGYARGMRDALQVASAEADLWADVPGNERTDTARAIMAAIEAALAAPPGAEETGAAT